MTIEEIKQYVIDEGLDANHRRRDLVYRRMYLSMYLKKVFGLREAQIGPIFKKDRTSIIHYIEKYSIFSKYIDFADITYKEYELFDMDSSRYELSSLNRTPIKWTEEEYKKINETRINNSLKTNIDAIKFIINNYEKVITN